MPSSVPSAAPIVQRHIHVLDSEPDRSLGRKEPYTVRVTCQVVWDGSVCKTLHVGLPAGAQVRLLRQRFKTQLPKATSYIMGPHSTQAGLRVLLEDNDFIPPEVTVSRFEGKVTPEMALTRNQCFQVQRLLQIVFEEPEVQRMLDGFEQEAAGAEHKYRWRLSALLQCEIYPSIARHFGLDEKSEAKLPVNAIGRHSQYDLPMTEAWARLEALMRNKDMLALAYSQLAQLQDWLFSGPQQPEQPAQAEADLDTGLPQEPGDAMAPLSGATPATLDARPSCGDWQGAWLLKCAVQDGEDLFSAELRLSELLRQSEGPQRERRAQRAAVRLAMGLYDAALSDVYAADGVEGAAAALVAAKSGLQKYDDALNACRRNASIGGEVREHVELLMRQSQGDMDVEETYRSSKVPALMPRTAEYLGPVKLGLLGQVGSRRRCLFAARAVEPGELLMSSCAIVHMKATGGKSSAEQASATSKLRESVTIAFHVYKHAAQISPHASRILGLALSDGCFRAVLPMQELFWYGDCEGASVKVDDAVIQGVVCTNAFKDLDESLFPAASMANHSCMPNAMVVKLGDTFLLRARRSIESGEEVTINYFDIMMPLSDRADRCKNWHFTCVCKRCEAEKKVPRSRLLVPLAMQQQISGMRNVVMGGSNVGEVIEQLESAVHFLYGRGSSEAAWVCGSFVSLYISQAEGGDTSEEWDQLLRLFEVVHPGSFIHCKLTLNRWRRARAEAGEEASAPAAWRKCVEAHRLRYGGVTKDGLLGILEETRRSVDQGGEEFCMN